MGNAHTSLLCRYFEDRFRERESTVEKLRLKNATLKIQVSRDLCPRISLMLLKMLMESSGCSSVIAQ